MSQNETVIFARTFENDILLNGKYLEPLTVSTNFNTTSDSPNNRFTINDSKNIFRTESEKEPRNFSFI